MSRFEHLAKMEDRNMEKNRELETTLAWFMRAQIEAWKRALNGATETQAQFMARMKEERKQ